MAYDRNPKFGVDQNFKETATRVTNLLWDTTHGDVASVPKQYLESLRHEYSDGSVSMLELIDKLDLPEDATYEDYAEAVSALMCVDPAAWPEADRVVELQPSKLTYEIHPEGFEFSEEDFEFAEEGDLSTKMETFFKKVIASVYLDGVTSVTDPEGNPPNMNNNYLMSADGKTFSGIFYDSPPGEEAKKFPFQITEGQEGKWSIKY